MAFDDGSVTAATGNWILVGFAWLLVSVPFLWGIWTTPVKAAVLFR